MKNLRGKSEGGFKMVSEYLETGVIAMNFDGVVCKREEAISLITANSFDYEIASSFLLAMTLNII